jgi:hypothetical protein
MVTAASSEPRDNDERQGHDVREEVTVGVAVVGNGTARRGRVPMASDPSREGAEQQPNHNDGGAADRRHGDRAPSKGGVEAVVVVPLAHLIILSAGSPPLAIRRGGPIPRRDHSVRMKRRPGPICFPKVCSR